MSDKELDYLRIRRKYRVEVPEDLNEFWGAVSSDNLNNSKIYYHYYWLQLLSIQEVIDYDVRKLRSWFREKSVLKHVMYFVPLAKVVNSQRILILGFDQYKDIVGVFLCIEEMEPIFIVKDVMTLLSTRDDEHQYGDSVEYLKKKVATPFYLYNTEEILIDEVLDFIRNCMSKILWGDQLKLERKESAVRLTVAESIWERSIVIETEEQIYYDEKALMLEFLNEYIWSSDEVFVKSYGFYMVLDDIVFLSHDELIEFVRKGMIMFYYRTQLPDCLFQDRINNYVDEPISEEEMMLLEGSMTEVFAHYEGNLGGNDVRLLDKRGIGFVVDYIFDSQSNDLLLDGIDEFKLKTEEEYFDELSSIVGVDSVSAKRSYLVWSVNGEDEGYSYIEMMGHDRVQFQFYYRDMSWRKDEVNDEFIQRSIEMLVSTLQPKSILSKVNEEDDDRIKILLRNGFQQIDKQTDVINEIGIEQQLLLFERQVL